MRERELKPGAGQKSHLGSQSLPMRERELKRPEETLRLRPGESLPMRERELKLAGPTRPGLRPRRSPCGSVN